MHELNTQDTEVITVDGCDFKLYDTQAAVSIVTEAKVHCYLR